MNEILIFADSAPGLPTTALAAKPFEYSVLDPQTADLARRVAEKIRADHRRTIQTIINTGIDLIGIKQRLGHGHFAAWLAAEFDWSERTAQRFMAAAEAFREKSDIVSDLPLTTIYALVAPTIPATIRENVVTRRERGEHLPVKAVNEMVAEARARANMAKRELKRQTTVSAAQRRRRESAKRRRERDVEKQRREHESRRIEQQNAAEEAAAWVVERGNPAELLVILEKCAFSYYFVDALRRAATSFENGDPQPAFLKGGSA